MVCIMFGARFMCNEPLDHQLDWTEKIDVTKLIQLVKNYYEANEALNFWNS